MIFYFKIFWRGPRKYFNKISIILLVVTILTIVSVGTPLKKIVTNRLAVEKTTVMKIFQGDASDLSYSSAGIRVHYWIEAWSWIKQRPLVGWGGNGNRLVIKLSKEFPESVKKEYRHLHNSYLDLLVNFGALGGLLYLSLLAWLVVRGISAWKSGRMPGDVLIFFLSFLLFWSIINCFESYIFFSSGNFVFALICGGILTHIWKVDIENLKSPLP
jgi:O-antigen ligase